MRASVVVGLLAVVAAGAECKRTNGAYCDSSRPCPSGFACDETARECHVQSLGGGDMAAGNIDMAGCTCSSTTPICVANSCVSCLSTSDPDAACAMVSPSTSHCLTTGADAGSCVGCRDGSDCTGVVPFCDATMHVCRGCIADSECASLVCDLTPGSTTHGLCVAISQVEYVNGSAATNGNGLTPTTPRLAIQDAINHATGADNRPYVHIAAGSYDESVGVNNVSIYLVGADGAIIHPTMNGKDALGATGATGSMTVRNLIATATSGNGGNCNGASFTAYRSQFIKSSQNGVYANNCSLVLDAVWVDSNVGSGIYIGAGDFQIFNSIITHNTNSGGFYQLAAGTTMVFVNNTVADNSASGTYAGVTCATAAAMMVRNTILYNNLGTAGTTIGETNCGSEFCASDDVSAGPQSTVDLTGGKLPGFKGGTPVTADSYHLTSTSPCRNEASPLYAPDHDFDFEHRPQGGMPDIGADEVP